MEHNQIAAGKQAAFVFRVGVSGVVFVGNFAGLSHFFDFFGDGIGSEAADGGVINWNYDDFFSEPDLRTDIEQPLPSPNRNQKVALSAV